MPSDLPKLPRRIPLSVRTLGPLARRLLRIGIPVGPNALLTVRVVDGRSRTFPITPLEHGGHRYVFSAFGEGNWVRDLRAAGEACLRRGRHEQRVLAVELTLDEGALVLRAALPAVLKTAVFGPRVGGWYGLTLGSTPEDYLRAARDHPGFELRPK